MCSEYNAAFHIWSLRGSKVLAYVMHQEMKSSFCGHIYQQMLETCFYLAQKGGIG
jgi:hypothetical protein